MIDKSGVRKKAILVFVSVLLLLTNSLTVNAATADDLREMIGQKRVTDESVIKDVKSIIYRYKQSEYKKKLIKILDTMGDFGYEDHFNVLLEQKDKSLEVLEKSFCSNDNVDVVIEKLNDSVSILSELGALREPTSCPLDELEEDEDKSAYQYASSVMKSIDDNYNIGKIGEGVTFPTKDSDKLQHSFGENAIVTSDIQYENNKGIDLYVATSPQKEYKANIVAQFNGKVKSVEKKNKGKYRITIEHGASLVTVYEYVSTVKVKVGDHVKQYQQLGYAAGDILHFEVILNTIPINPLFLYGDMGEQVYNDWCADNPGMAYEKTDFSKVKQYIENKVEGESDTVSSSVVYENDNKDGTNIKFEDDYVKPEVPISDYIEAEKTE